MAIMYSAHLWTISYEEQFYLVIPWALRLFYRLRKKTTTLILCAFILIGFSIRAVFIYLKVNHPAIWVFPPTHFESIFGGLIVGLGLFDETLKKVSSWFLLAGGLTALWLVSNLPDVNRIQWKLMFTYPLVGIGSSLILFAVMQGGLGPVSTLFRNRMLGYLGKISYGLYVYHIACLKITSSIVDPFVSPTRLFVYPVVFLPTALLITILISSISYEFFEKKFLRMKDRFTLIYSRPI